MKNEFGAVAGVCLIGLSLSAASALALAAENDPGAMVSTHVDWISVSQTGAIPVIEVSASGAQYDTVADPDFSMTYNAGVSCKGLWDVHYFEVALGDGNSWYDIKHLNAQDKPIGSYTDLLASWGVDTQDKSRTATNRTLGGPIKPQLRDAAINKCKAEAQDAANDGNISLAKAMSTQREFPLQSAWIDGNLRLQAWTSCGKPQDQITWLSVFDEAPDIKVRCLARPYAEGVDTGNTPNQIDNQFLVTGLTLAASPTRFQGACPKELVLNGTVATNKAGSVNYRWRIGNTQSAPKTLTFDKAESRNVTHKITVDQSWERTITLLTDGPGERTSNPVQVQFSCVNAHVPDNQGYAPTPPPPPAPKPPRAPPPAPVPPPAPGAGSDLVPGATVAVGNGSASWGHTLTVNASKSNLGMQGNACGLGIAYAVRNIGQGNAAAFKSRLAIGANPLHVGNVQSLAAGADKQVSGTIFLANGDYDVLVHVDHAQQVGETNEGNNMKGIRLKVRNCGQPGNGAP